MNLVLLVQGPHFENYCSDVFTGTQGSTNPSLRCQQWQEADHLEHGFFMNKMETVTVNIFPSNIKKRADRRHPLADPDARKR